MAEVASDGTAVGSRLQPKAGWGFLLRVVAGPDAGTEIAVSRERACRLLFGQSEACDVKLTDRLVSRRHFAVEPEGERLRVTDLGSTNGTLVNGVVVLDALLVGGERVRSGGTEIAVERVALPEGAPAAIARDGRVSFGRLIGKSDAMQRLYPLCERLAASHAPVVIEGETGVGKEVLAEALHEQGARSAGPFVVLDCSALPAGAAPLELFGAEAGAVKDAPFGQPGAFEEAHGGTLLLDEVGELDMALQAKLLRAIERGEVKRLGATKSVAVDVRVVVTTRRDLDREVAAGRFRDDLFLRLAVARIEVPPLRRREGDVEYLAAELWRTLGGGAEGIPFETMRRLEDYAWPGNVRELHNVVARLVALGPLAEAAPDRVGNKPASNVEFMEQVLDLNLPLAPARQRVVDEFERRYVARVVTAHGGNVGKAAAAAGIARRYFQLLRAKTRST